LKQVSETVFLVFQGFGRFSVKDKARYATEHVGFSFSL
jgi:hypothetical protein